VPKRKRVRNWAFHLSAAACIVAIVGTLAWLGHHWFTARTGIVVKSHTGKLLTRVRALVESDPSGWREPGRGGLGGIAYPGGDGTLLATARGCGLYRGSVSIAPLLTLPPPLRVTIAVAGDHDLSPDGEGIKIGAHAVGRHEDVAALLDSAPAPEHYWPSGRIATAWIDPATREVTMLLPCPGEWRMEWMRTHRSDWRHQSMFIVLARGDQRIEVASGGERHEIRISPDELRLRSGG